MIKAIIFDLDGTLIQTEVLKANSYAQAIQVLTKDTISEKQVLAVFEKYVGLSRPEVVKGLYNEFSGPLHKQLSKENDEMIREQIINRRLAIYREMLNDTSLLSNYFCTYSLGLLQRLHEDGFKVVLATMSHQHETQRIINILGITNRLELICTRDDVVEGKPNPEIYLKAKDKLGLEAEECLVIEDSVNGIRAGINAGMQVFAVTNNVTRKSVHDCNLLADEFIVDELTELIDRVYHFLNVTKSKYYT